ncbi:MAG: hypothetical protein AAGD00_01710 [Planctomycetota bacterium]
MDDPQEFKLDADLIRACGPDEGPLRELVLETLRNDRNLVKEIANGDEPSYEGSLKTLTHFVEHGEWPEKDEGWIAEAVCLTRWGYRFHGEKRESWETEVGKDGRPNARWTLRTLCACMLLGDLARWSNICNSEPQEETPDSSTCFRIVDTSCRLGGEWPAAAMSWLADFVLWKFEVRNWWGEWDALAIIAPMAMLSAWLKAERQLALPVHGLFDLVHELEAFGHKRRPDREPRGWLVRVVAPIPESAPRRTLEGLVLPVLDRLPPDERAIIERTHRLLRGKH